MFIRVIFNAISNYAHLIISILIALVMSPFLVHTLGDFYYGIWSIIAAITGYFSLLDLGMNRAIVRYLSKYDAEGDTVSLNVFFNTSLALFSAMGLVILLAALIIAANFDRFLDLQNNVAIAKTVVLIAGIDFAFTFPFGAIYAVLIAKQRHTAANKINIINTLIRNGAIYVSLSFYPNIVILAACNVIFNIFRNLYIIVETRKVAPELRYRPSLFDRSIIRKIYDYSLYSFAASVSARIINFTDEIVVGHFLKVSDVTYYAIAVNLISYFEKIIWAGASVFVPYISQLDATGDQERIEYSFFLGSRFTLLLTLYIFYGLLYLGKPFIHVWMGEAYAVKAFPVLILLASAKVIASGQSMTVARLFGTSQHKFIGILNSIEAISNLGLSLLLVQWYGMLGVALGTLIPCFVTNGIALPLFTVKIFDLSIFTFLRRSIAGPAATFIAASIIAHFLDVSATSFMDIFLQALKISFFFFLFALPFCLDRNLLQLLSVKWKTRKSR